MFNFRVLCKSCTCIFTSHVVIVFLHDIVNLLGGEGGGGGGGGSEAFTTNTTTSLLKRSCACMLQCNKQCKRHLKPTNFNPEDTKNSNKV